jgi:hypothetical protein
MCTAVFLVFFLNKRDYYKSGENNSGIFDNISAVIQMFTNHCFETV